MLQQVNEVMTLFAMEKELRIIKNRGHFPVPQITPQGTKIENPKDIDKILEVVDKEVVEMLNAVRESELKYEKESKTQKQRTTSETSKTNQ